MVVPIGLAAALLLAAGFVLQQHVASRAPAREALSPRLFLRLIQQPRWLVGIGAMVAGQVLGGVALGQGGLSLVEPLLAANLVFALPLAALMHRRRIGRRDVLGALAVIVGLAVFVAAGDPTGGDSGQLPWPNWGVAGGALVGAAVLLTWVSLRSARVTRAALLGAAAGVLYGLQDALTRTTMASLGHGDLASVLFRWYPYVLVVVAACGLLLAQSAFNVAPLAASLPAINIGEPLTGIAFGVGVFSEHLQTGPPAVAGEAAGLALMLTGVFLLARSPVVHGAAAAGAETTGGTRAPRATAAGSPSGRRAG